MSYAPLSSRRRAQVGSRLLALSLILVSLTCSCGIESRSQITPPESIILISLDTLRADYLNLYGYTDFETSPFLDSLATESVVFDNAIVVEPRTLTSHMSLFTGLYPQHHRVQDDVSLPKGIETLASTLMDHGYRTAGLADGGYLDSHWGFSRGFERYSCTGHRGFAGIIPEARQWLDRNDPGKFFLFLHSYDVHAKSAFPFYRSPPPFHGMFSGESDLFAEKGVGDTLVDIETAKSEHISDEAIRYVRSRYAEGVRYVDEQLKSFFEYLKERGIYDRALVIIWSDHGEGLRDHGRWLHDQVYDHTIRSVLIVKIPGIDGEGRRIQSVVSAIDVMPTILDVLRLPIPESLDGQSFLDLVFDDSGGGEAFSIRTKHGLRLFSIRTPRHHLFWGAKSGRSHFFDLKEDPGELRNLSPSNTVEERRLRERLAGWVEQYEADRRQASEANRTTLSPKLRKELRALGYVK